MGDVLNWFDRQPLVTLAIALFLLGAVAWTALLLTRGILLRLIERVVRRSATFWDEVLLQQSFFHRLSWAVPLLVIYQGISAVPHLPDPLEVLFRRLAAGGLILVGIRAMAAFLAGVGDIYNRYPMARHRPIKGYLQVVSILVHLVGLILIVAALVGQSPLLFFSGIGAMTAILLLIFRDTLLSLVAGVQLTSNDLIRVGDWIEMPQFDADGDVIDIALNSVSVQNWDRTISVIPTHKFLEHSFRNWRGMQDSGGRRIKRAITLDLSTVRFLDEAEVERLGRIGLLQSYMAQKCRDLEASNLERLTEGSASVDARRLTNVGTFRAYVVAYLRQHPRLHQDMTFLVRQLAPGSEGLPLEVYVFSNETAWANYEGIQADIFDHLLAVVPEFGLRVFQKPSGADVAALGRPAEGRRRMDFDAAGEALTTS